MKFIRDWFSLAAGVLATICYRDGMEVAMSLIVMTQATLVAYDVAMLGTDGKHSFIKDIINDFFADGTKKENQRSQFSQKNKSLSKGYHTMEKIQQEYFSYTQAMQYIGIKSPMTLRKYIDDGLPTILIGKSKLISKSAIDKFMQDHTVIQKGK